MEEDKPTQTTERRSQNDPKAKQPIDELRIAQQKQGIPVPGPEQSHNRSFLSKSKAKKTLFQHRHTQSLSSSLRNESVGTSFLEGPTEAMQFLSRFSSLSPPPPSQIGKDASASWIRTQVRQGDQVGGYQIGPIIGRGGFCECRLAEPLGKGDYKVVFKIFRPHSHREEQRDFEHELDVWGSLSHPNILPLLETIRTESAIIAVMPMVAGGTLLDRLMKGGPMGDREARNVFRQLALAVAYLHGQRGIVHRDIKLDNILMDADCLTIYLSDFGLSDCVGRQCGFGCQQKTDHPTHERGHSASVEDTQHTTKGSIHYIPPESLGHGDRRRSFRRISLAELASLEQETSDHDSSDTTSSDNSFLKKADIWAMGVVLYAMVKGSLPFCDDFLPRLQLSILKGEYEKLCPEMGLSPGLCDLVSGLLNPDVNDRLSIEEVLEHSWVREEDSY